MEPDAKTLIEQVMAKLGCETPAQLTDALGLGASAYGMVNRWVNGNTKPSYDHTIRLLNEAGWLQLPGMGEAAGSPATAATGSRQDEAGLADAVSRLEAVVSALRDQLAILQERFAG